MEAVIGVTYYRTDIPDSASELFDGELVIAHYGSGLYYSLSRSGTLIWQGLRHGLSVAGVVKWLEGHFTDDTSLQVDVDSFVERLSAEGLLVEVAEGVKVSDLPGIAVKQWAAPVLERFDDLQELLLLDPVHDVSEAGWPHRPDDT
jgi:hypothetical protein